MSVDKLVRKYLKRDQKVHSGELFSLNIVEKTQNYETSVTPSYLVDEWLPWVHIGNLKAFLLGKFHGILGKYLPIVKFSNHSPVKST